MPVLLLLLVVLLASCSSNKWDDPDPTPLAVLESPQSVQQLWSHKLKMSKAVVSSDLGPSSDGAFVYSADYNGQVISIALDSGEIRWAKKTKLAFSAGPSVSQQTVVLATLDGQVLALNAQDGSELWRINTQVEIITRPTMGPGIVVLRGVDGTVLGINIADGSERWLWQREVPRLSIRGNSQPVVDDQFVYMGLDSGEIVALNADDGKEVWEISLGERRGRSEIERLADVDADIVLIDDELYAVGYRTRVVAIDKRQGRLLWDSSYSSLSDFSADWENIYLTDVDGVVTALSRASGRELWRQEGLKYRGLSPAIVSGQAIVLGDSEGFLHWLSRADGKQLTRARAGSSALLSKPINVADKVIAMTADGNLVAFRLGSGS